MLQRWLICIQPFELNIKLIFGCGLSILWEDWKPTASGLCTTFTCRGHHKLSHAGNIISQEFCLYYAVVSVFNPFCSPTNLLHLSSSLSGSFWETQTPSNYSFVFYLYILYSPFLLSIISSCLQTVPRVQLDDFDLELCPSGSSLLCERAVHLAGYAVCPRRAEEILRAGDCWDPDVLLCSHPRRCLSLWVSSQASASGHRLCLDQITEWWWSNSEQKHWGFVWNNNT